MENLQDALKKIVAKRVVKQRTTMNYSQGEVLAELERRGIARTQGSLSQIERGKRLPSVETLYVLAQYLETSTDYLLGLTQNELSAAEAEEDTDALNGDSHLNRVLRHLPGEQRRQVVAFAEYLLAQSEQAIDAKRSIFAPTQRQREDAAMRDMLESVQRDMGVDARKKLEQILRAMGLLRDLDT